MDLAVYMGHGITHDLENSELLSSLSMMLLKTFGFRTEYLEDFSSPLPQRIGGQSEPKMIIGSGPSGMKRRTRGEHLEFM